MPDIAAEEFPSGLLAMSAESSGGVRTPFNAGSGRPTGSVIHTPVVRRIEMWVKKLTSGASDAPDSVLLVGGPGNGKSDIVEHFITILDETSGCNGALIEKAKAAFSGIPPRRVVLDLQGLPSLVVPGRTHIEIVQDASSAASGGVVTPPSELLVTELKERIEGLGARIFLGCVNRGVVASAIARANSLGEQGVATLLEEVAQSVSVSATDHDCWPLVSNSRFAVWPMDMESLVLRSEGQSPFLQILEFAVNEEKWLPESQCPAGPLCPFHTNRRLLSKPEHQEGLLRILGYGELAAGRRRTFRDLLSLVSNLLAGQEASYRVGRLSVSPCEWAADRASTVQSASSMEARFKALMDLVQKLYPLVLFSRWPKLQDAMKAYRSVGSASKEKLQGVSALLQYLARYRLPVATSVSRSLAQELGPLLDPVEAPSEAELVPGLTVGRFEDVSSYSTAQAFELVSAYLEPLEVALLQFLMETEKALSEDGLRKVDAQKIETLRQAIKIFAARFTKRVLGARAGVVRDLDLLRAYLKVMKEPKELFDAAKLFKSMLNDAQGFHASLLTTFGQPSPSKERDIRLRVSSINVDHFQPVMSDKYPVNPIPRFKVGAGTVPVTYPLYRALREVESGIDPSSLDSEVLSLLEGIRARLAGTVVRDTDRLRASGEITFGDLKGPVSFDFNLVPQRAE